MTKECAQIVNSNRSFFIFKVRKTDSPKIIIFDFCRILEFLEQLLKAAMEMEEINLSQLVIYQQEEQQRKNKVKRKVYFSDIGSRLLPLLKPISRKQKP